MSDKSKTLSEERKTAEVKEKAEQELLAIHERLKAAQEKMRLLTRKTGSPSSAKQTETRKTGFPSSAQNSQQGDSVEENQRELTEDISLFTLPQGTGEQGDETGEQRDETGRFLNRLLIRVETPFNQQELQMEPLMATQPMQLPNLLLERMLIILSQQRSKRQ